MFTIEKGSYHFIDKKNGVLSLHNALIDINASNEAIKNFFYNLTDALWTCPDSGNVVSTVFQTGTKGSKAKPIIDEIISNPNTLLKNSIRLARLLFDVSPVQASRGVLAILLVKNNINNKYHLVIYKIKSIDDKIVHLLLENKNPELDVQEVQDTLIKDLQKGALIPHPIKERYDVKVIEKQNVEPTFYFKTGFLGCLEKVSEEHQIAKLLPELQRFAQNEELSFHPEIIPDFLIGLSRATTNIGVNELSNAIEASQLLGSGFNKIKFNEYAKKIPVFYDLDVEPVNFIARPKGNTRVAKYSFTDPRYAGLGISGPPDIFKSILKGDGDSVVFTIKTTQDQLIVSYE